MTFKHIEKEFDEKYPQLLRKRLYEELDLSGKITIECSSEVKSFLKQSFIKYLQSEVEACNQYKTFYNPVGDEFNKGKHKAMDDRVERLQAQIKELEA